jgi:hypothetical protein
MKVLRFTKDQEGFNPGQQIGFLLKFGDSPLVFGGGSHRTRSPFRAWYHH